MNSRKKLYGPAIEPQPHETGSTGCAVFVALMFSVIFTLMVVGWIQG